MGEYVYVRLYVCMNICGPVRIVYLYVLTRWRDELSTH